MEQFVQSKKSRLTVVCDSGCNMFRPAALRPSNLSSSFFFLSFAQSMCRPQIRRGSCFDDRSTCCFPSCSPAMSGVSPFHNPIIFITASCLCFCRRHIDFAPWTTGISSGRSIPPSAKTRQVGACEPCEGTLQILIFPRN